MESVDDGRQFMSVAPKSRALESETDLPRPPFPNPADPLGF